MSEDPTRMFPQTPDTGELTTDRKLGQIYTALIRLSDDFTRLADEFSMFRSETARRLDRIDGRLSAIEEDNRKHKIAFRSFQRDTIDRLTDLEQRDDLENPPAA